jgi:hypothetical protein
VFSSLDFGAPRWIIHFFFTRWILGIFSANSLDFDYFFDYRDAGVLDPALGYHMYAHN